jgi:hypothetical protein
MEWRLSGEYETMLNITDTILLWIIAPKSSVFIMSIHSVVQLIERWAIVI